MCLEERKGMVIQHTEKESISLWSVDIYICEVLSIFLIQGRRLQTEIRTHLGEGGEGDERNLHM